MKTNQKGRSMVEMLGVLAIIGVLSAGGLAGYSKAMFRHRVNQTIDIFSQVLQRFSELEQKGFGNGVTILGSSDIIKYGILPNCQIVNDEDYWGESCQLPLGILNLQFNGTNNYINGEFVISFFDKKSCVAFSSVGWENVIPVDWWNPLGYWSIGSKTLYDSNNVLGEGNIREVSISDIIEGCSECDGGRCVFWLAVHEEI